LPIVLFFSLFSYYLVLAFGSVIVEKKPCQFSTLSAFGSVIVEKLFVFRRFAQIDGQFSFKDKVYTP
jgi:hypothetical protein